MHCVRCDQDKSAAEFQRGRPGWCIACKNEYDRAYSQRRVSPAYYDTDPSTGSASSPTGSGTADLPDLDETVEWTHTDPNGGEVVLQGKTVGYSDGRPVVQVAGCHFKLKKVKGEGWSI
jgi:hypothetical protein